MQEGERAWKSYKQKLQAKPHLVLKYHVTKAT